MKSLFFAFSWLLLATGVTLSSIAFLTFYSNNLRSIFAQKKDQQTVLITSANTPNESLEILGATTVVETDDARALLVTHFLRRYNGEFRNLNHPLKPEEYYGKVFVEIADKYGIDFRLLPAIAMQESNLCTKTPKVHDAAGNLVESFNCLGFGVHEKGTLTFPNFESNFDRAARELKKNYIDQGRTTPELIMKKYTPSSPGSWADSVNQWMAEMRFNDRKSGIQSEDDADLLEFIEATQSAQ